MGGKPAPPFTNIWLAKFEPDIKDSAKLFERYMDDIIREIKRQERRNQSTTSHVKIHHGNGI